ncbi:hypothetical protein [Catellatospora sichuanensis]|uniref:hypothetical protein n=1 Tax=Catellatospora sichuanensis TaxID=1969805 RepID=UPI001642D943|nr:hypothetical protein [Catellatospora sichuanensis]
MLLPAVGAVVLIALVSGPPQETVCSYTAASHMVDDGNNHTIIEPDGVRCRRP